MRDGRGNVPFDAIPVNVVAGGRVVISMYCRGARLLPSFVRRAHHGKVVMHGGLSLVLQLVCSSTM